MLPQTPTPRPTVTKNSSPPFKSYLKIKKQKNSGPITGPETKNRLSQYNLHKSQSTHANRPPIYRLAYLSIVNRNATDTAVDTALSSKFIKPAAPIRNQKQSRIPPFPFPPLRVLSLFSPLFIFSLFNLRLSKDPLRSPYGAFERKPVGYREDFDAPLSFSPIFRLIFFVPHFTSYSPPSLEISLFSICILTSYTPIPVFPAPFTVPLEKPSTKPPSSRSTTKALHPRKLAPSTVPTSISDADVHRTPTAAPRQPRLSSTLVPSSRSLPRSHLFPF
jgi:hypothetical protein